MFLQRFCLAAAIAAVFYIVLASGLASSESSQAKWMGYVEQVGSGCVPDAYMIEPARLGKLKHELYENDKVVIRTPGCTLVIRYGSTIKEVKETFVVPSAQTTSLYARVVNAFALARSQEKIETDGHARSGEKDPADEEVTIPLLKNKNNFLRAGTRSLYLAWRGGVPPFDVKVFASGQKGALVACRDELMSRDVVFESVLLVPGKYRVAVGSANGLLHHSYFTVVEVGAVQSPPMELMSSSEQGPPLSILQAIWLASQASGTYRFEAYQQLANLTTEYPETKPLLDKLGTGWRPNF